MASFPEIRTTGQVKIILEYCKSQLGSSRWSGLCQGFVATAYSKAMGKYVSTGTAKNARKRFLLSNSTPPPVGAAVYMYGSNNDKWGHVGIYVGEGLICDPLSTVKLRTLQGRIDKRNYIGWGWQGGTKPSGTYTENSSDSSTSSDADIENSEQTQPEAPPDLPITRVSILSEIGRKGTHRNTLINRPSWKKQGVELTIESNRIFSPVINGEIRIEQSRRGSPSKLSFDVIKDPSISFNEGNPVTLRLNGNDVFAGFVFEKSRSTESRIKVTCYDQIRYLKNNDSYSYGGITYSELLKRLADDYGLLVGSVDDTVHKLPNTIEETAIIDMLQNAADITLLNTGIVYVLYDDFGKLCLKNIENLVTNYLIDKDTAESFDYTSTIDKDVYTQMVTAYDDPVKGERVRVVYNNKSAQENWGILTNYEKYERNKKSGELQDLQDELSNEKTQMLRRMNAVKRRELTVNNCVGNTSVRPGCAVAVKIDLGDLIISNFMMVEQATHKISQGRYTMDLRLVGIRGEFR